MTINNNTQLDSWKKLMESYDPSIDNVSSFCRKANISKSRFYYYKKRLGMQESSFLPCMIKKEANDNLTFKVNDIAIKVSTNIDDDSLRRIISICNSL